MREGRRRLVLKLVGVSPTADMAHAPADGAMPPERLVGIIEVAHGALPDADADALGSCRSMSTPSPLSEECGQESLAGSGSNLAPPARPTPTSAERRGGSSSSACTFRVSAKPEAGTKAWSPLSAPRSSEASRHAVPWAEFLQGQLDMLDRRSTARLEVLQRDSRSHQAGVVRLEQRLAGLEKLQERADTQATECARKLSGVSDTTWGLERRVEAAEGESRNLLHRVQDEMQQGMQEMEGRMHKMVSSLRSTLGLFEEKQIRSQQRICTMEMRCEEARADVESLGASVSAQHLSTQSALDSIADDRASLERQLCFDGTPRSAASGGLLAPPMTPGGPQELRVDGLTAEVKRVAAEMQDSHSRITAVEELSRHLRTHVDLRQDQLRGVVARLDRGETSTGQMELLRNQLRGEVEKAASTHVRVELLEHRTTSLDGLLEDMRELVANMARSMARDAAAHHEDELAVMSASALEQAGDTDELFVDGFAVAPASDLRALRARLTECDNRVHQLYSEIIAARPVVGRNNERTKEEINSRLAHCESILGSMQAVVGGVAGSRLSALECHLDTVHQDAVARIRDVLSHVKLVTPKVLHHERLMRSHFGDGTSKHEAQLDAAFPNVGHSASNNGVTGLWPTLPGEFMPPKFLARLDEVSSARSSFELSPSRASTMADRVATEAPGDPPNGSVARPAARDVSGSPAQPMVVVDAPCLHSSDETPFAHSPTLRDHDLFLGEGPRSLKP